MQEVYMFFDDSGVLHRNAPNRYFVYAGYAFVGKSVKEKARGRYKNTVCRIRNRSSLEGELKATYLEKNDRNELYKVMKKEHSMGLTVDIQRVRDSILDEKKSIHRFKDYVLKRLIKDKMNELIDLGLIDPNKDVRLSICVDEQGTATNGYYNFHESVYEELKNGVHNFNYGTFYEPIVFGELELSVNYCDSKNNYLIQASDILANRIWVSFKAKVPEMRDIPQHLCLRLP
ncbi:DUF3800 domain-containing protein [Enterococcus malodoratus]|uniref:DUF3800 domain-containing protein n=1 Tax=Enterococcus malodoratus TaxID=71451 RepID=UPI0022E2A06E|nr:DUF3800 domain-containing protein [Enterococcus malodoratus]